MSAIDTIVANFSAGFDPRFCGEQISTLQFLMPTTRFSGFIYITNDQIRKHENNMIANLKDV